MRRYLDPTDLLKIHSQKGFWSTRASSISPSFVFSTFSSLGRKWFIDVLCHYMGKSWTASFVECIGLLNLKSGSFKPTISWLEPKHDIPKGFSPVENDDVFRFQVQWECNIPGHRRPRLGQRSRSCTFNSLRLVFGCKAHAYRQGMKPWTSMDAVRSLPVGCMADKKLGSSNNNSVGAGFLALCPQIS